LRLYIIILKLKIKKRESLLEKNSNLEKAPMSGIVLTFPILNGKVEAWRRFCQELAGSQLHMYLSSRRRLGITHERMALVETAYGATAATTIEGPNVAQALGQILTSSFPFDIWYRKRLQELYGVKLEGYEQFLQPIPTTPNQELLFEWTLTSIDDD
jgi:hypothetical protein